MTSRNSRFRRRFPRPPGERLLKKKNVSAKKKMGARGATNGFKNFRRAMRIPNMCLVLKLDNGKVVSIANEQTK